MHERGILGHRPVNADCADLDDLRPVLILRAVQVQTNIPTPVQVWGYLSLNTSVAEKEVVAAYIGDYVGYVAPPQTLCMRIILDCVPYSSHLCAAPFQQFSIFLLALNWYKDRGLGQLEETTSRYTCLITGKQHNILAATPKNHITQLMTAQAML